MISPSASRNADYFDELSGRWDSLMSLDERARTAVQENLDMLGLQQGDTVLDAGCGTGVLFPLLFDYIGPKGLIIGLDVSRDMLAAARRKYPAANVKLVCAAIEEYVETGKPECGRAIACFQAFPHFENQQRVLEGFHRRLAPGGRFIVFHLASSSEINAFHATLPPPVNTHRLPPVEDLKAWALAAGFAVRETREEPGLFRLIGEK
jgi:ubiquinone/menaquinone biosynthesis C-methylase UbiE